VLVIGQHDIQGARCVDDDVRLALQLVVHHPNDVLRVDFATVFDFPQRYILVVYAVAGDALYRVAASRGGILPKVDQAEAPAQTPRD